MLCFSATYTCKFINIYYYLYPNVFIIRDKVSVAQAAMQLSEASEPEQLHLKIGAR